MNIFLCIGKKLAIVAIATSTLTTLAIADDPASRFREAQQLQRTGKLDAALEEFDDLREQYPDNVDYSLARAQVLARMGRDSDALSELDIATRLAPDYEDVWRLNYALLSTQAGSSDREALESLRRTVAERFPLATWWQPPKDTARWTILAGTVYDDLSNGLPSWNNQFLDVTHTRKSRDQFGLRLGRDERFTSASYSLGLHAEHHWVSGWFAGAGVSLADDSTILPDFGYSAHLGIPLDKGWITSLAYRRREYQDVSIGSLVGTVEKYHGDFRFAYTLTQSHLHGASYFMNQALTTNWFYSDSASISATISGGREAEALGNGRVLESRVRSLSIGGRYRFGERFGLQWWVGTHEQGNFYRRRFIGMALSIRI